MRYMQLENPLMGDCTSLLPAERLTSVPCRCLRTEFRLYAGFLRKIICFVIFVRFVILKKLTAEGGLPKFWDFFNFFFRKVATGVKNENELGTQFVRVRLEGPSSDCRAPSQLTDHA